MERGKKSSQVRRRDTKIVYEESKWLYSCVEQKVFLPAREEALTQAFITVLREKIDMTHRYCREEKIHLICTHSTPPGAGVPINKQTRAGVTTAI